MLLNRSQTHIGCDLDYPVEMHQASDAYEMMLKLCFAFALQVRERIETSGRDARWEFNKATLFSCSNYMAEVCGNLMEMVEVVDDFFKFLGPELKAVTGEQDTVTNFPAQCMHSVKPVLKAAPGFLVGLGAAGMCWPTSQHWAAPLSNTVRADTKTPHPALSQVTPRALMTSSSGCS